MITRVKRCFHLSCHAVDGLHVVSLQHFQAPTCSSIVTTALTCHLLDFLVSDIATNEFVDIDRHTYGVIETFHGLDTLLYFIYTEEHH